MDKRVIVRLAAAVAIVGAAGGGTMAFLDTKDGPETFEAAVSTAEVLDLDWENLVPEAETASARTGVVEHEQVDEGSPWQTMTDVSAVRTELNGKRVRIPGYMTPLSFEEAEVGQFLLVPYVGACVHVPPPPANQIVYVEVEGTVPVLEMWEPFMAVGTLHTQPQSTELAEVGYTMSLDHLEVYEEPEVEIFDDTQGAQPS